MSGLLPPVTTYSEYAAIYRQEEIWLPAMRTICQRHGLEAASLRLAPPGTHVVFWAGEDKLIKLFAPLWSGDFIPEKLVLGHLLSYPEFTVPRLLGEGELEGWPYLLLTRIPGAPLEQAWEQIGRIDRERILASLGEWIYSLHKLPEAGLEAIAQDWPVFIADQMANCQAHHAQAGASPEWLAEMDAFLKDIPPLYKPGFKPVLLSADLTAEHIFVQQRQDHWELSGVIDFGDAMLGHPYYEFIAPSYITRGEPRLQRALLYAYGFTDHQLTEELAKIFFGYILLHRFANIPDSLKFFGALQPRNIQELRQAFWGFSDDNCE